MQYLLLQIVFIKREQNYRVLDIYINNDYTKVFIKFMKNTLNSTWNRQKTLNHRKTKD